MWVFDGKTGKKHFVEDEPSDETQEYHEEHHDINAQDYHSIEERVEALEDALAEMMEVLFNG